MSSLYFDNNATTPLHSEVHRIMHDCLKTQFGNPSSNHSFGRKAHELVEESRDKVARSIGALPQEVFFTSSGTESNNWFVSGISSVYPDAHFYYGATEHPCILKPMQKLKNSGMHVKKIPCLPQGGIDFNFLESINTDQINIISLMHVNNETGAITDLKKIRKLVGDKAIIHSDAVQALGKIDVNFHELGIDFMTISSHKINGPQGIAALIIKNGIDIDPFILGGGQESGMRSGTENIVAIAGFAKACELNSEKLQDSSRQGALRDLFESKISELGAVIFAQAEPRIENTSFFGFPSIDGATLITALDKYGIGIASGSACSSNNKEPSHVLIEMGMDPMTAQSAVRLSLSTLNTQDDVLYLIDKIKYEVKRLTSFASILN